MASVISSIFAADPFKSLKGVKDILFYTITFFVACSISDERKIRTILWSLYITTTISAISGIFDSVTNHQPLEIHTLGNQNYTAMFYMIIITSMISMVLFSNREHFFKKSILIIFTVICLIASVMTLMRASFLGLLTFFLLLMMLKKPSRSAVFFIFGFIFLTVLILYSDSEMRQKLLTTKSMISRLDIWKSAISLFLDNPFTGVGLNHFNYRFPSNHPVEPDNIVRDAHSLYFQTASQMGFIGLVALILIIVGFVKQWLRFKDRDSFCRALRFGAMGAFLIIIITGVFDTTLHHEHAIAFTIITGLTYGYFRSSEINGL